MEKESKKWVECENGERERERCLSAAAGSLRGKWQWWSITEEQGRARRAPAVGAPTAAGMVAALARRAQLG